MKRDVVYLSLKRFKFEKIEESDFRLDVGKNGRLEKLKISNLNLTCVRVLRKSKTYRKVKYLAIQNSQVRT